MADFKAPCGVCMIHKTYTLRMEAMLQPMELTDDNREELMRDADENALAWAHRDAQATGGWEYLADEISDAGVFFYFGAAALRDAVGEPRDNDVLAEHIRSTGNLPASFHGGPCGRSACAKVFAEQQEREGTVMPPSERPTCQLATADLPPAPAAAEPPPEATEPTPGAAEEPPQ